MFTKGVWGELLVSLSLKLLPKRRYHVFNNLTIEVLDGTSQIDHLVVSRFGVFVVETKFYSGKIYGRPGDKQWTQFFSKSKKFQFQNPVRQNYRHIKCLEELTGFDESIHRSIVCFLGSATFKHELPHEVQRGLPLGRILFSQKDELLTEEQVRAYTAIVRMTALPSSSESASHHIESLTRRHNRA